MPFLSVLPLVGHMPLFTEAPVPFSAMRYQPPRWYKKQHGPRRPMKQWRDLTETDTAMIEAAALKRVERKQRRAQRLPVDVAVKREVQP